MLSTLWKTCKWLVLLVVLLIAVACGYVAYLWKHSDQLLATALLDAVQKWAPNVRIELRDCRLDWFGRVYLEGFVLSVPGDEQPLLTLPVAVINLDRDAFIQRQELLVDSVRLVEPHLEISRAADGTWNWQKLPPFSQTKKNALPECLLEKARLVIHITHPDGQQAIARFSDLVAKLSPNGKRNWNLEGTAEVEQIGQLSVGGRLNVDTRAIVVSGKLTRVRFGRGLLNSVSQFEPRILAGVAQLEDRLRSEMLTEIDPKTRSPFSITGIAREHSPSTSSVRFATNQPATPSGAAGSPVVPAALPTALAHQIPLTQIGSEDSILGLVADLDVGFRIDRSFTDSLSIDVNCNVSGGEITNTAFPFPLTNVTARIQSDGYRLVIHEFSGLNGPTEISLSGELARTATGPAGRLAVQIHNLACDERLRSRLSPGFGKIYDAHHLRGSLDMEGVVASDPSGKWKPESLVVSANKCSVMHDVFPYPVEEAVGSIRLVDGDFVIDMQGLAGRQPITLTGRVANPGPDAAMVFDIRVVNLPIDEQFLQACSPALRRTVEAMNLKGLLDGHWRLTKPAGEGRKFVPQLVGQLHDGSMVYEAFPYRVDALAGKLAFDGTTWSFTELSGVHGGANLSAEGTYTKESGYGDLQMTIVTQGAPLGASLYDALPERLKIRWQDVQPRGTIKHMVTKLSWQEGRPAVIALPEIVITRGRCLLTKFPYELTDIEAELEYIPAESSESPAQIKFKSFEGRHDGTLLIINRDGGLIRLYENGDWRARLENWRARDLKPDLDLQRAVSPGLRTVLTAFDPDEVLDLEGLVDLWGTEDPRYPITAAWSITGHLSGNFVSAGMDFHDVHGRIRSKGKWDGQQVDADGELDLESLKVFEDYELNNIQGPFRLRDDVLSFGSLEALGDMPSERQIDPDEQVTARFVLGVITLNGMTTLDEIPEYHVRVNLSHGQLETFARQYLQNRDQLRGTMHGWLNLRGQGPDPRSLIGTGQLQISPAALYQMPVIIQVLNVLTPQPNSTAAFNYALLNFRLERGRYVFDAIDLVGESIQLRGKGRATFEGDLDLMFYSMLPYSMLPKSPFPFWVPVVSEVSSLVTKATREATKGWVVVRVSGKTSQPQTEIVPAANFDDALKGFLNTLRPLPLSPQPLRPAPPITRSTPSRQVR